MTGIDHAAVARALLGETQGKTAEEALVFAVCAVADATLALVEQQRIANLIAFLGHCEGDEYEPLHAAIKKGLGIA